MIVEQKKSEKLIVGSTLFSLLYIEQGNEDLIELDKQGAKELIKVLQEFVGRDKDIESEALRLNNLG